MGQIPVFDQPGTGAYKGIKSLTGGVMKCTSPDSVHLACTQKLRVTGVTLR